MTALDPMLFLPDPLLTRYNFFELYPFDGGGYFIQQQIVGSLDDRAITKRILDGALDDFGPLESLDFTRFEHWSSIEKSCWINRMYFIVSMARCAMLDKDAELARTILNIIRYFNHNFPPPATGEAVRELERETAVRRDREYNSGNADGEIPYQWFDFQPAARIVNVLNAMNFLKGFDLPGEEFDKFIRNNARVIYDGGDEHRLNNDNHQSLRGLALLYAGRYLNEPEYLRAGNAVAGHHMRVDYQPDGMGVDMSPSYHVFVSWIHRDAARLGSMTPESRAMLRNAFRICREFRLPDHHSIVLNDGYSLDLRGFLESIGLDDAAPSGTCVLPLSGMAFYHAPEFFAALDATPCLEKYAHFHGGKNGITLWFRGDPVLADPACCSYDDKNFWEWFKQPRAHSTLLVNGKGDAELRGRYEWGKVEKYKIGEWRGNSIVSASSRWTRELTIVPQQDRAVIADRVDLPENAGLEFIFVLHPSIRAEIREKQIRLTTRGGNTAMLEWEADGPVNWKTADGKFYENNTIKNNCRLVCSARGAQFRLRTIWSLIPGTGPDDENKRI